MVFGPYTLKYLKIAWVIILRLAGLNRSIVLIFFHSPLAAWLRSPRRVDSRIKSQDVSSRGTPAP
jgi:hypothetical protein